MVWVIVFLLAAVTRYPAIRQARTGTPLVWRRVEVERKVGKKRRGEPRQKRSRCFLRKSTAVFYGARLTP